MASAGLASLLGPRRLGLALVAAAVAGFWIVAARVLGGGIPEPMWVLGAAAFPLEAVALIAVPGGRRVRWVLGRHTPAVRSALRWREGVVLLLAAIQVLTLMSDATSWFAQTGILLRAAALLVLAVAAAGLAFTLRISRYFLLLVVLCYPVVVELVAASVRHGIELMGLPTDGHLSLLYLPPLLLLAGIMIVACTAQRPRALRQPGSA